ncbi:MAG: hypothetical protein KGI08_01950 [Thaumarchaeota archaeon]|nr:hypothetical protein [Nitrososphaerota archaeon]
MTDTKALAVLEHELTPAEFKKQHNTLVAFVKAQLNESKDITKGGDFGLIPGTKKKSLFKPGAEKLLKLFGLAAHYELVKEVEDFDKGFLYYKYRCVVTHAKTGTFISDAIRSSNNKEPWIKNKSTYDAANSVEAKAQKRALVAATVQATMASEIFDAEVNIDEDDEKVGSFKADENPERTALLRRLYGTAAERGFGEVALHKAAIREYGIKESLSELSNGQLKEFIERITLTFMPVEKGQAPKKFDSGSSVQEKENTSTPQETSNVQEGEIVDEPVLPTKYFCKGKKHDSKDNQVETTVEHPWCSQECQDSMYPPKKERDFNFGKKNEVGKTSTAS